MAWNNAQNVRLSDLSQIVAGDGDETGYSTSQTRLRADCANVSSGQVRLWDSFKGGAPDISFAGAAVSNADDTVWTSGSNFSVTATMNYSAYGTYFITRVIDNQDWLYSKWQADKTSGDDTQGWGTRTSDTAVINMTLGSGDATDFWEFKQVVPSGTAFERFYCNSRGGHTLDTENVTIYDTSGGGGGV